MRRLSASRLVGWSAVMMKQSLSADHLPPLCGTHRIGATVARFFDTTSPKVTWYIIITDRLLLILSFIISQVYCVLCVRFDNNKQINKFLQIRELQDARAANKMRKHCTLPVFSKSIRCRSITKCDRLPGPSCFKKSPRWLYFA